MRTTYDLPISIDNILEAKQRLAGKIYKTGIPRLNYFNEHCQGEIFLELESMQHANSFKIRGALNKLCSLTTAEEHKGVVACPADNHTQGVSLSCTMFDIDGKMVIPKRAPKSKVATTCDYSAEVVLHDNNFNDILTRASDTVELEGRIFTPPYDDPQVITGQGIVSLEILENLYDVDNVIVPIGGDGLIAGIAIAIKSINPTIRIIGIQSENVHDMATSWYTGEITSHRHAGTLVDSCDVARSGRLTYEITRQLVDDIVLVSGDDVHQSMVALIQRNRVITERARALTCVVLLGDRLDSYIQNRKTVSLISRDNIDLSRVSQITDFVDA